MHVSTIELESKEAQNQKEHDEKVHHFWNGQYASTRVKGGKRLLTSKQACLLLPRTTERVSYSGPSLATSLCFSASSCFSSVNDMVATMSPMLFIVMSENKLGYMGEDGRISSLD